MIGKTSLSGRFQFPKLGVSVDTRFCDVIAPDLPAFHFSQGSAESDLLAFFTAFAKIKRNIIVNDHLTQIMRVNRVLTIFFPPHIDKIKKKVIFFFWFSGSELGGGAEIRASER